MTDSTPVLTALSPEQRASLLARLNTVIDRSGGPDACWPFTGGSRVRGYGVMWTYQQDGRRRLVKAHRVVFEDAVGESPPTVDHECHDHETCPGGETCAHRLCCNPAHMVAATLGENGRRAQFMRYDEMCSRGHRLSGDNLYESEIGNRQCRTCAAARAKQARAEAKSQRPARPIKRSYRPRGMGLEQLVDWAVEGQSGKGCWGWKDPLVDSNGYVSVRFGDRMVGAHRLVYQARIGPIPDGHVIDHTCHDPQQCEGGLNCPHRQCVNPAHLAAVPNRENVSTARAAHRRVTHCVAGHEFTPENTYVVAATGSRVCKACTNARQQAAREVAREGVPDGRVRATSTCKAGRHDVTVAGLTPAGRCAGCRREASARYKQRQREGATLAG